MTLVVIFYMKENCYRIFSKRQTLRDYRTNVCSPKTFWFVNMSLFFFNFRQFFLTPLRWQLKTFRMPFQKGWGNGLTNQNRLGRHPPHPLSDCLRYHWHGILGLKLSPLPILIITGTFWMFFSTSFCFHWTGPFRKNVNKNVYFLIGRDFQEKYTI
jgi:hypothetical protein